MMTVTIWEGECRQRIVRSGKWETRLLIIGRQSIHIVVKGDDPCFDSSATFNVGQVSLEFGRVFVGKSSTSHSDEEEEHEDNRERSDGGQISNQCQFCLFLISGHNKVTLAFKDKQTILDLSSKLVKSGLRVTGIRELEDDCSWNQDPSVWSSPEVYKTSAPEVNLSQVNSPLPLSSSSLGSRINAKFRSPKKSLKNRRRSLTYVAATTTERDEEEDDFGSEESADDVYIINPGVGSDTLRRRRFDSDFVGSSSERTALGAGDSNARSEQTDQGEELGKSDIDSTSGADHKEIQEQNTDGAREQTPESNDKIEAEENTIRSTNDENFVTSIEEESSTNNNVENNEEIVISDKENSDPLEKETDVKETETVSNESIVVENESTEEGKTSKETETSCDATKEKPKIDDDIAGQDAGQSKTLSIRESKSSPDLGRISFNPSFDGFDLPNVKTVVHIGFGDTDEEVREVEEEHEDVDEKVVEESGTVKLSAFDDDFVSPSTPDKSWHSLSWTESAKDAQKGADETAVGDVWTAAGKPAIQEVKTAAEASAVRDAGAAVGEQSVIELQTATEVTAAKEAEKAVDERDVEEVRAAAGVESESCKEACEVSGVAAMQLLSTPQEACGEQTEGTKLKKKVSFKEEVRVQFTGANNENLEIGEDKLKDGKDDVIKKKKGTEKQVVQAEDSPAKVEVDLHNLAKKGNPSYISFKSKEEYEKNLGPELKFRSSGIKSDKLFDLKSLFARDGDRDARRTKDAEQRDRKVSEGKSNKTKEMEDKEKKPRIWKKFSFGSSDLAKHKSAYAKRFARETSVVKGTKIWRRFSGNFQNSDQVGSTQSLPDEPADEKKFRGRRSVSDLSAASSLSLPTVTSEAPDFIRDTDEEDDLEEARTRSLPWISIAAEPNNEELEPFDKEQEDGATETQEMEQKDSKEKSESKSLVRDNSRRRKFAMNFPISTHQRIEDGKQFVQSRLISKEGDLSWSPDHDQTDRQNSNQSPDSGRVDQGIEPNLIRATTSPKQGSKPAHQPLKVKDLGSETKLTPSTTTKDKGKNDHEVIDRNDKSDEGILKTTADKSDAITDFLSLLSKPLGGFFESKAEEGRVEPDMPAQVEHNEDENDVVDSGINDISDSSAEEFKSCTLVHEDTVDDDSFVDAKEEVSVEDNTDKQLSVGSNDMKDRSCTSNSMDKVGQEHVANEEIKVQENERNECQNPSVTSPEREQTNNTFHDNLEAKFDAKENGTKSINELNGPEANHFSSDCDSKDEVIGDYFTFGDNFTNATETFRSVDDNRNDTKKIDNKELDSEDTSNRDSSNEESCAKKMRNNEFKDVVQSDEVITSRTSIEDDEAMQKISEEITMTENKYITDETKMQAYEEAENMDTSKFAVENDTHIGDKENISEHNLTCNLNEIKTEDMKMENFDKEKGDTGINYSEKDSLAKKDSGEAWEKDEDSHEEITPRNEKPSDDDLSAWRPFESCSSPTRSGEGDEENCPNDRQRERSSTWNCRLDDPQLAAESSLGSSSFSESEAEPDVKSMKKVGRFRVPKLFQSMRMPVPTRSGSERDLHARGHMGTLLRKLDFRKVNAKTPKSENETSLDVRTVPQVPSPTNFGAKVRRSLSMSDANFRPRSPRLPPFIRKPRTSFTLGRLSAQSGSVFGSGISDFENIRYKVGLSSFYVISDGAASSASCLSLNSASNVSGASKPVSRRSSSSSDMSCENLRDFDEDVESLKRTRLPVCSESETDYYSVESGEVSEQEPREPSVSSVEFGDQLEDLHQVAPLVPPVDLSGCIQEEEEEECFNPDQKEGKCFNVSKKEEYFNSDQKEEESFISDQKDEEFFNPNETEEEYSDHDQKKEKYFNPDQKEGEYFNPDQKKEKYFNPDQKEGEYFIPDQKEGEYFNPDQEEEEYFNPDQEDSFGVDPDFCDSDNSETFRGSQTSVNTDIPSDSSIVSLPRDMLSKKKRFSVSEDRLASAGVVSGEPEIPEIRLSASQPNLYHEDNKHKKEKRKGIKSSLKKLKGMFRSSSKLTESEVYKEVEDTSLRSNYNNNPIFIASPEEELQEVTGFPGREDLPPKPKLNQSSPRNPGALTDSDLVSWNWSNHPDSESGDCVEVCEEETQVGTSLLLKQRDMDLHPIIQSDTSHRTGSGDKADFIGINLEETEEERGVVQITSARVDHENENIRYSSDEEDDIAAKSNAGQRAEDTTDNGVTKSIDEGSSAGPDTDSVAAFEQLEREVAEEEASRTEEDIIPGQTSPETISRSEDRSNKEKLERPLEDPIISGPLEVALSMDSEWKRRYISVVGTGLFIWTNHKSKTPTARLKLRGLKIQTIESSGNTERSILSLSKKGKVKLVLKADTAAEFQGWFTSLSATIRSIQSSRVTATQVPSMSGEGKQEEADSVGDPGQGRSRSSRGRNPVPAPRSRSKTPSRVETEHKDISERIGQTPKMKLVDIEVIENDVVADVSESQALMKSESPSKPSRMMDRASMDAEVQLKPDENSSVENDRLWDEQIERESVRSMKKSEENLDNSESIDKQYHLLEAKMDFGEEELHSPVNTLETDTADRLHELEEASTKKSTTSEEEHIVDSLEAEQIKPIESVNIKHLVDVPDNQSVKCLVEGPSPVHLMTSTEDQDLLDQSSKVQECEKVDCFDSDEDSQNTNSSEISLPNEESNLQVVTTTKERFTPTDVIMDTIVEVSEENDTNDELEDNGKIRPDGANKRRNLGPVVLENTDDFAITLNNHRQAEEENEPMTKIVPSPVKYVSMEPKHVDDPNPISKPPRTGNDNHEVFSFDFPQSNIRPSEKATDDQGLDFPEIENFDKIKLSKVSNDDPIGTFEKVKKEILSLSKVRSEIGESEETKDNLIKIENAHRRTTEKECAWLARKPSSESHKMNDGNSSDEGIGIQDSPFVTMQRTKKDSLKTATSNIIGVTNSQTNNNTIRDVRKYAKKDQKNTKVINRTSKYSSLEQKISLEQGEHRYSPVSRQEEPGRRSVSPSVHITKEAAYKADVDRELKEDIPGNCVKSMARFWEDYRKKVEKDKKNNAQQFRKKWNSMPNLKKSEARRVPAPTRQEPRISPEPESLGTDIVVKSGENVNDIDLCRSVSVKDRKKMLEHIANRSALEDGRQWRSLPSLEHRAISPEHLVQDDYEDPDPPYQGTLLSPAAYGQEAASWRFPSDSAQSQEYVRSRRSDTPSRPTSLLDTNAVEFRQDELRHARLESPFRSVSVAATRHPADSATARTYRTDSPYRTSSINFSNSHTKLYQSSSNSSSESSSRLSAKDYGKSAAGHPKGKINYVSDREDFSVTRNKGIQRSSGSGFGHHIPGRVESPAFRSYELSEDDWNLTSPSSVYSSSTVNSVVQADKITRYNDDSGGEIYLDYPARAEEGHGRSSITLEEDDSGLYVHENGVEFSLTPLSRRKSAFEPPVHEHYRSKTFRRNAPERASLGSRYDERASLGSKHDERAALSSKHDPFYEDEDEAIVFGRGAGHSIKSVVNTATSSAAMDYVKSCKIPYIEEEKFVLNNINIVNSVKKKFLQD